MDRLRPGRMELLALRRQRGVIQMGLGLLRSKREALLAEFQPLWREVFQRRRNLEDRMRHAATLLGLALGVVGRETLIPASWVTRREIRLDLRFRNLWGVRYPELHYRPMVRSLEARGYAPVGTPAPVDGVAQAFEEVLDQTLQTVSEEVRLRRLGEEIRKVGRRIQMLEHRMLPELERAIREIQRVLEEREREERFRLKRQKRRQAVL